MQIDLHIMYNILLCEMYIGVYIVDWENLNIFLRRM